MKKLILFIAIVMVGVVMVFLYNTEHKESGEEITSPTVSVSVTVTPSHSPNLPVGDSIYDPVRVTKKPFGIYVSPDNSPVQPEKFTGYHTGVDFETTASESNIDVPVSAFCDGKLLLKEYATGYGGVAVQSCTLNNQAVTIIYGHLYLASIKLNNGDRVKKGDPIGNLGKGYSVQTDGERKHLHLGIHKGTTVDIRGYVQQQSQLLDWLNPTQFLK